MESISITGSKRKSLGKADAKALRNEGLVPCIIYGGKEEVHVQIDERAFNQLIFTPNQYIANIDVDGQTYATILKDVQYHPLTDRIVHVDFQELVGRPVKTTLPIHTKGQARGVLAGGRLRVVRRDVRVQGLPEEMPSLIELDITNLRIGKAIKIGDLKVPGVEFLADPNQIVVAVRMKRGALVEDEEEETEEGAEGAEGAEATAEGGDAPAAEAAAE
ncbi:MAG: 50S ribosomal protein L25 [Flavobacteriales bacterium]|nr:50S ribosomal protein L25 [Flavobacteriales bacterium]MCB9204862.1 50S ribosomal protein L25 [Flavobacteriales bacterium]